MKLENFIRVIFVLELSPGKIICTDILSEYLLINWKSKNSPKFPCHICDRVFTTRRRRNTHVDTHSDVRNLFSCPKCDRRFTWIDSLKRHLKIIHFLKEISLFLSPLYYFITLLKIHRIFSIDTEDMRTSVKSHRPLSPNDVIFC
ncbi:hypothetical protein NPIL_20001 [Nephila pilipes]|uniref:C2H2-type domain-containing protein n=1 Tax=Nephila pilipes TaxID=299642 RepID=A0A8X6PLK3_NEPPI|nr:hypothetical protein NPIL_20001 [Nephila pilipes]